MQWEQSKGVLPAASPVFDASKEGSILMFLSFFPRELGAGQLAAQQGRRSTAEHAGSQRDVVVTPRGHELLQPLSSTRAQVMNALFLLSTGLVLHSGCCCVSCGTL